jgi:RNA recognition motif-containing protein
MGNRGMPCKLFVGGVSAHTTTDALRGHFSKYGRIIDAVVMQKNGRPRGFGFVTFDHPMPAECALAEAQWLDGRLVDVKRAVPGERAQERASNKIFVGGLPQDVSTEELRCYFSGYGTVADAVVMVDRRTNRSRGFGFVRFGNGVQGNAASEAVLMDFAGHRLAGKWVEVKRATPASQLQDMFPGEAFDEEMYGMTAEDLMAAASMGMSLHDYMNYAGWESPCGDSTPMSMAGMDTSSSGRSHARGRRARRRKQREQRPGSMDEADMGLEDFSDDGASPGASFSMPDTPLGDVAFISTSNSCSTTASPTAAATVKTPLSAWGSQSEARALIPVDRAGTKAERQRVGSGNSKSGGSPSASENDPSRANTSANTQAAEPMKIFARREEGGFTREDFLSLEVGRPGLLAAW